VSNLDTSIIERIEAAIIELLKKGLPSSFYIAPFPDDPRNFDSAKMKASALVHYSGSRFGLENNGNPVSQVRNLQFTIALYLHSLRDHVGGYRSIENARKALQNVPVEGATPFRMLSDALADQSNGQWTWQLDIACTVPAVALQTVRRPIPRAPLNQFQQTGT
jgi:hypothetical protein